MREHRRLGLEIHEVRRAPDVGGLRVPLEPAPGRHVQGLPVPRPRTPTRSRSKLLRRQTPRSMASAPTPPASARCRFRYTALPVPSPSGSLSQSMSTRPASVYATTSGGSRGNSPAPAGGPGPRSSGCRTARSHPPGCRPRSARRLPPAGPEVADAGRAPYPTVETGAHPVRRQARRRPDNRSPPSTPGASDVFTHGLTVSPRATAFFGPAAPRRSSRGVDVFVQLVIAAITTDPASLPLGQGRGVLGHLSRRGERTAGLAPSSTPPAALECAVP